MDDLNRFLEYSVGDIEVWRFLALIGWVVIPYLASKFAGMGLTASAEKLERRGKSITGAALRALAQGLVAVFSAIGLRIGLLFLGLDGAIGVVASDVASVLTVLAVGWLVYLLMDVPYAVYTNWSERQSSKLTRMIAPLLRTSLRMTIVVLTLVQVAQVLSDKPITSIIAGLGIGGLAFALAAQDSLKHLFGSIVIFTDRPFEVGDRLIIDGHDGPVEEVGFRSTKIRTLAGHLVTIPNGELVNKNIQNVSKRPHIRRVLNIGLRYDTPPEKMKRALEILKELLHEHEGIREDLPPRVYFSEFNADNLNIMVIYWYHPPDYWNYMEYSQNLNLQILERFNAEGLEFAFPTQTLHLAGDPGRPVEVRGLGSASHD